VKAVLQYRASPGFQAKLAAAAAEAGVRSVVVDESDDTAYAREIADAQVLLHVLRPVTAAMLDHGPGLKLVQKLGVGVNTIDLEACRARGVAVANMPGTNSQAVAEMTLALMLAALRRLAYFDPLVRRGEGWRPDLAMLDGVGEIAGKTVGLVGYGAVPQRLAPVLKALGAEVLYTARSEKPHALGQGAEAPELLECADIVTLHAPATDQTRRMIDRAALGRMKPGAILVNTARGELVDQAALAEALASGGLGAAGLDVFAREPVDPADPLLSLPNVVVAPHVAWLTPETLDRSLEVAMQNCGRIRAGEPLLNRVA
jgi:phosphoglycerate dehydrogenase-like enzyme